MVFVKLEVFSDFFGFQIFSKNFLMLVEAFEGD